VNHVADKKFNMILANIHLNVLLNDMPVYRKILRPQGQLIISGFYEKDQQEMMLAAHENGFKEYKQKIKNKWLAIALINQ
jgi:ribosomal protein L11 methyltransferase